mgnify:CR=1 FL=1
MGLIIFQTGERKYFLVLCSAEHEGLGHPLSLWRHLGQDPSLLTQLVLDELHEIGRGLLPHWNSAPLVSLGVGEGIGAPRTQGFRLRNRLELAETLGHHFTRWHALLRHGLGLNLLLVLLAIAADRHSLILRL